jgi:hypothetical protein
VLLVVAILSSLALAAVAITDQLDLQSRYEDTNFRLDQMRRAVAIDSSLSANGQTVTTCFAADLGRLPDNLPELVEPGTLPAWQFDTTANQWAGWRGPYLSVPQETQSGLKAFRDGWGNTDPTPANDALFFGWNFSVDQVAGQLIVQSYGADGVADGAPGAGTGLYDADFPPSPPDPMVEQMDYQANLKGWTVFVEFDNTNGSSNVTIPNDLRLRVYYPQEDGSGGFDWPEATWPATNTERDEANYLSLRFIAGSSSRTVNAGQTKVKQFRFSSATVTVDKWIVAGDRTIDVVQNSNGSRYDPAGLNPPVTIQFMPRANPPSSTSSAPLFTWLLN